MNRRLMGVVFAFALFAGVFVPLASASQDNKEIRFTINGPMEIPGEVLGPGTYDLKLTGNGSTIAGVWNNAGTRFYGFFDTVLVDRAHSGNLRIDVSGLGKNAPKRLADWFYPGDHQGNEIMYPAAKRVQVAKWTTNSQTINP